jgi:Ca2+-transporting ATPase
MKKDSKPWSSDIKDIIKDYDVSIERGLSKQQVIERQNEYKKNVLYLREPVPILSILYQQVKSVIVLLLSIASIISFLLGQWLEGLTIIAVLIVNTFIGFITEHRAIRSMEALRKVGKITTKVLRDGKQGIIDSDELVPGDIVLFEAGDIVSADIRLIEVSRLTIDESALTGESVPVEKHNNLINKEAIISDHSNMLFRGTFLTSGSSKGIVTATGMQTEIGKIAKVTQEAHQELTPLEERLDLLGKRLLWVSIAIGIVVAISGILAGKGFYLMLETAVALAVAAIPEGLPVVATLALGKGMWRLSKQNVLVNRLSAVETLGATSVIFTDKTGTITENKMKARKVVSIGEAFDTMTGTRIKKGSQIYQCLKIAVLCNNANFAYKKDEVSSGDPMEIALLELGAKFDINRKELLEYLPELKEEAFNPEIRMMATIHQDDNKIYAAIKGAPESVIAHSSFIKINGEATQLTTKNIESISNLNINMAHDGLRVIAVASKVMQSQSDNPYSDMLFEGFIGLLDPARPDIKQAIAICNSAGIRVAMATGDQAQTAQKIAKDVELDPTQQYFILNGDDLGDNTNWSDELKNKINQSSIFSRVSPTQKLSLINFFQQSGFVVAMTGDGVNDAPALKKADIGVAMGLRGTQVAKDAADMVLGDDKFTSIVFAIKQGRIIYSNIQKFVIYLLSCNISEVLVISIATLLNTSLPLLPLQILFLNLVTDVFPALALGMGEGDNTYLNRPPRDNEDSVITKRKWGLIFYYGFVMTISVLFAFFITLNNNKDQPNIAVTVSFLTIGLCQVFHVFNMRLTNTNILFNDITKNPHIWAAVILCTVLLVLTTQVDFFINILSLSPLSKDEWLLVVSCSLFPLVVGNISNLLGIGIKD